MPRVTHRVLVVFFTLGMNLWAQQPLSESPRSLSGSLTLGWLDSDAQEFFREHRSNPFTTLRLDYQSYLFAPDFLTYRVQPRFSSGFQDTFTGMSEGSGVAFETVFLPRRPWPFRFHYSRFRRSALTAGLSSSYTRFISQNDDSTLGFQWQYIVPKFPAIQVSFDKIATTTTPEAILTQGFGTHSRTASITARDSRMGWIMNGGLSLQRLDTQYLLGSDRNTLLFENHGNIRNMMFMAQRPLPKNLNVFLTANRNFNQSEFDGGLFSQNFNSFSGKLEYRPEGRFQASSQVRMTRSALESQIPQLLGGPGLLPPSARIANNMLDTEGRYQLHANFSLFARNEFTHVSAVGAREFQRAGNFMNSSGGAQFFRARRGLVLSGSYYLYGTSTRFEQAASARLLGQSGDSFVSIGDPSRLRVAGGFSINRSREEVRSLLLPYTSDSERARLALARTVLRRWTIELQGALTALRYKREELRSEFQGKDYGVSLTGPRQYLGYSRSIGAGNSLQPILELTTIAPVDFGRNLLLVIGSSNSSTVFNGSWNLSQRMSVRGIWRSQVQSIGASLVSRFDEREATFNWQFRKVRVEAGYLLYRFDFGSPIQRKNIIFRLTREFRVF